mmetsp:Transcript_2893/g.4440  ORF Transcript_2893/g.4440 Transcript_2893/m.4440 type:complete len:1037 (-) Transcript_2893:411-3521(-)
MIKKVQLILLVMACLAPLVSARLEPQLMILFLFTALFLGAVVTYILSRFAPGLPYTVVVFACGAGISVLGTYVPDENVLKESIKMWDEMEPELILFLFLPALLFGEAMLLNFHHVRGAVAPAAILAGPGALFGAFAMAALVKLALPYGWDWSLCLIFGVILCATDPVAVVALLKSAGASHKLTYLIIGEALMNDGTALVLYNLLYSLIKLDNPEGMFTAYDVAIYFVRVIVISPLMGFAFGMGSVACLSVANRRMQEGDTTIQMAITICCAYLTFFCAEFILHVSGVLCCCAAAITLSRFAVPLFLRPETIHSIWAAFEWIGNTLIFILAGLIIGSRSLAFLKPVDIINIFIVYFFMFLIRGCMMVICYPLLSNPALGKPSTWSDCIFATWGGLRGAVSMALALSLLHSTEKGETTLSADDSHRVFFLVGGVAGLTLLVNATTSSFVLQKLALLDESSNTLETRIMFHYVKKRIRVKAMQLLEQLRKSRPTQINPYLVARYCSILSEEDAAEISVEQYPMQDLQSHGKTSDLSRIRPSISASNLQSALLSPQSSQAMTAPVAATGGGGGGGSYKPPGTAGSGAMSKLFGAIDAPVPAPDSPNTPGHHPMTDGKMAKFQPGTPSLPESPVASPKKPFVRPKPSRNFSILGLASDDSGFNLSAMDGSGDGGEGAAGAGAAGAVSSPLAQMQLGVDQSSMPVPYAGGAGHDDVHDDAEDLHQIPDSYNRPVILNDLLSHIRRAFLEVVRVSYWRQINSGKLPRKSSAALILLNSIDVALETTDTPGLQDWDVIEAHYRALFQSQTNYRDPLNQAAHELGAFHEDNNSTATNERTQRTLKRARSRASIGVYQHESATVGTIAKSLKDYREAQIVYLLTTFIDAHHYAQKRIPYYLGDTETIDTPEEALVVQESREIVAIAKARLAAIDPSIVTLQCSKQTARWILHMQEDQIEEFLHEGIITPNDAEALFAEVEGDLKALGKVEWINILLAKMQDKVVGTLCCRSCCPSTSQSSNLYQRTHTQSADGDDEFFDCEYVQVE